MFYEGFAQKNAWIEETEQIRKSSYGKFYIFVAGKTSKPALNPRLDKKIHPLLTHTKTDSK